MSNPTLHILVIGHADVGRRTCAQLTALGVRVTHLAEPDDAALAAALASGVTGVAVTLHDDIKALRYSLAVHHLAPGAALFVAIFDRTVRAQLQRVVPDCVVLSPAAISLPQLAAASLGMTPEALPTRVTGRLRRRGLWGRLGGQGRPYDAGSAVLIAGIVGLLTVIVVDTAIGLTHAGPLRALYDAARTTATISAPAVPEDGFHLVWATAAALLAMGFTAMFGAGLVHHLLSGRHVALLGARVMPRRGHVIVVGMGQVGLRLAQDLRQRGVAVLGIESNANARTLTLARQSGIPVLIGDGASRAVLASASVAHCEAVVAAGSEDRDNIAVALAALAVRRDLRLVLRAGMDDAIAETRSLFHIGAVIDVNGLTAQFIARQWVRAEGSYGREGALEHGVATTAGRCQCGG